MPRRSKQQKNFREEVLGPKPRHWTYRRKALICRGIELGFVSISEAAAHYGVPIEEVSSWYSAYKRRGIDGLRLEAPGLRRGAA
jgi:transposase